MSRRIVVGLEPSEHSKAAVRFACDQIRRCEGVVVGVTIVDLPGIERAEGGYGPGAGHYAKKATSHHLAQAEKRSNALLRAFEETAQQQAVAYEAVKHVGDPAKVLAHEGASADLVVVGTRTHFHYETRKDPGDTLKHLLRDRFCPVAAIPKEAPALERVLITYDGSVPAARAMRLFGYVTADLPTAGEIMLLHVAQDSEAGQEALKAPARYLRVHGQKVQTRVEPGEPAEAILRVATEGPASLIVLGATSKGALSQLLFGGVAKALLDHGGIPLFVAA